MTDHFDFAVKSLFELVDNQVHIVTTVIIKEHWDFEVDLTLQVTFAMGGANTPARYVIVISIFVALRFTLYNLVTAYVAPRGIFILLLLAGT